MPPGPPVLATLLAEIYGPDAETRLAVAEEVKKIFTSVPYIVDVDQFLRPSAAAACASASIRTNWNISASSKATFTTRSSRCSAAFRSATRIAARNATRSRSASACRSAT